MDPRSHTKKHEGTQNVTELILKDEVYAVVGAAIEVHKELGFGFLEPVYQEAMEIEPRLRNVPFQAQVPLMVLYKGQQLNKQYMADLVCYDKIIVELKALERFSGREEAQLLNYLKAAAFPVGLLINFGSLTKLEWKRFVR
jgi:GxxExxY protein